MFKKIETIVAENKEIAKLIFKMLLKCEGADIEHFVPGQFANLAVPGHNELLLRRPVSICTADAANKAVTLIYQIKGKGTEAFSKLITGTKVSAILPVGRGFNLKGSEKNIFLIGGGVGIAPLLSVTQKWPEKNYTAFLGYRGAEYEYCLDDFKRVCKQVIVTSDDGTLGEKGLVTDALKKSLNENIPDVVLACGPIPMIRALKDILKSVHVPAQVSMEQRMCCGFGACSTCVCGIENEDGFDYKKVCIEGPVFDLYEVEL
jgi:dihydroorotate dehydrogenase electron transfer subunit